MESGIKGTWQCDAVTAMTRQPENAHSQPMVSGQRIALLSARARPQLGTSSRRPRPCDRGLRAHLFLE